MKVIIGNVIISEKQKLIEKMALEQLGDMAIHEVFHVIRRRGNINQAEIAKEAKVQPGLLSLFERGTIILPEDDIQRLFINLQELNKNEASKL